MEFKKRKSELERLDKEIKKLKDQMGEILRPWIGDWFDHFEYVCIPFWDCELSPVGWCVYNNETDPAHDNCLFCGLPLERS